MISEEDKVRMEEAKTCNDCLCWHKYCKAECCKMIFFDGVDPKELNDKSNYIIVKKIVTWDEHIYYSLHGIQCLRNSLRIPKQHCVVINGRVVYVRACDLLDENNLCIGHPEHKPLICQKLTAETAYKNKGIIVTDNCLFRYKEMNKYEKENGQKSATQKNNDDKTKGEGVWESQSQCNGKE